MLLLAGMLASWRARLAMPGYDSYPGMSMCPPVKRNVIYTVTPHQLTRPYMGVAWPRCALERLRQQHAMFVN